MPSAPGKLAISRRTWLASASSMATRLTRYLVCSPHTRASGQPLAFGKLGVLFVDSSEIIVAQSAVKSSSEKLALRARSMCSTAWVDGSVNLSQLFTASRTYHTGTYAATGAEMSKCTSRTSIGRMPESGLPGRRLERPSADALDVRCGCHPPVRVGSGPVLLLECSSHVDRGWRRQQERE